MKTLHFWPLAWTLAVFSAMVFTLNFLFGLLFPNWWVIQNLFTVVLPGYTFISTYFLGLVEIFIAGLGTAVVFVPIWNFFASREKAKTALRPEHGSLLSAHLSLQAAFPAACGLYRRRPY